MSAEHHNVSLGPLIIEVAINGERSKASNPHVPLSAEEIVASVDACARAGASVVHAHAGQAVVGAGGHHDSAPYETAFAAIRDMHPGLLMYPTIPGGSAGATMADRLAHVCRLAQFGLLGFVPVDPGTMNYGRIDAKGRAPTHSAIYQTTYADVDWSFELCRKLDLPCTMSVFEPGFVRLIEAHRKAGTLPPESIVKLEFSAGERLFGLLPNAHGLEAWLQLFDQRRIAWMVTLRDGDPADGLAQLAIRKGGHVRVGIEDYGGPLTPRNEELVANIAAIGRAHGRTPALAGQVRTLLRRP